MASELTFHDLTSKHWPASWSPFTIRTTLCLNYLGLSYKHNEISYPDIASFLPTLGVQASGKSTDFTLPAVTFPDKTIMESTAIAEKLASTSAEFGKKLFPQGEKSIAAAKKFDTKEVWGRIFTAMAKEHILPFVPAFLDDRGREYFYRTREEIFGGGLDEMREGALEAEKEHGLQAKIETALVPLVEFYGELDMQGSGEGGVFAFGGGRPQYLDFQVVALVQWWVYARGGKDVKAALESVGGGRLAKVMEGCKDLLKPKEVAASVHL
ncbi:hypothetical protein M438DRAFT_350525 [Aureobasidium pullulans EXF-150]|uniref:Uncharacterized protein n=1 Tax=Aureobasidium pullulans EXF-150 TaxID=1043002 RepID=A0A074XU00_AURPU|nr:uncharacterized protein M438DRAFT_350525 [Aureobasidium pullulans EXF-150]KEQ89063.1 hypothetical protein M438DRAFT_350525 [Aureobasidium pullulans EXF-150]